MCLRSPVRVSAALATSSTRSRVAVAGDWRPSVGNITVDAFPYAQREDRTHGFIEVMSAALWP